MKSLVYLGEYNNARVSKVKLLFVVNVDWFFISHRLPIALKAQQQGFKVTIACRFTSHKAELKNMGFEVIELPFNRSGGGFFAELKTIKLLKDTIVKVKPDVVHAVTIKPVLYAGLALKMMKKKIPFVAAISGLGYVFTANTLRAKVTKIIASLFYKVSLSHPLKTVIFQNSSDEAILTEVTGLTVQDKTLIKGSGADLSVYNFTPEIEDGHISVVMACRLLKEKGVYEFVNASKLVKDKYPNSKFVLVGSPDIENPNTVKQSEIDSWVADGIIEYLGQRNDIPDIFSSSNIVCLPSYYGEGVPKVLIEAAACGRAIVTTTNPGCRDAIIDNQTGLAVPPRNADSLAKAIIKLIENPNQRRAMGTAARDFAVEQFDVKQVVNKHIKIYQDLIERAAN
ncbi:glycosyltransferase family 4 protein [Pseudoalteromonas sp. BZK2]|uniref:Glycosyl transferase family 1 n=1 Tax=Pseudoalteromonas gelatinilytica TaxID=1703256 RepID=A0ABQ1TNW4_9GAMM|nr:MULTISPECIES: glycosyltransferase family 4 protein [Pseudoalteromonas]MBC7010794.1 glycosyltransferase family 4 protein [Pseudoalteromonas sp. BZK2]GGF00177.1 glycosyl transferase family 1 [Pseudoalteromonas profundi]